MCVGDGTNATGMDMRVWPWFIRSDFPRRDAFFSFGIVVLFERKSTEF